MLEEIKQWGVLPLTITGDSWYSKKETFKFFKDKEQSFFFAIKSNRKVSLEKKQFVSIKDLEIPDGGAGGLFKRIWTSNRTVSSSLKTSSQY
jgi:hypothetical protein